MLLIAAILAAVLGAAGLSLSLMRVSSHSESDFERMYADYLAGQDANLGRLSSRRAGTVATTANPKRRHP